ncbi:hypothetical protein BJ138DRAFT_1162375 [Hygrophoropsis aurantiaca]|uniref:Uncharacterized protein n=1 Tax=Hygrophoropsis aurantiaca TaxID=72124 RepID=A0ACB8A1I2_9AGAM|nr:hypothetical protein BJ138DRAFT_1162375 [Hygrophoropsis aurantiaca]
MVSESETQTAMTTVRFSWGWHKRLTNRISSLLRNVRPQRINASRYDEDTFGVHSTPSATLVERHKSANARMATSSESRSKGKRRAAIRPTVLRNETSSSNVSKRRSKSIERWARSTSKNAAHDLNAARLLAERRGSETLLLPESQAGPSQPHSRPSSRGRETPTLPGGQHHNRFSFSSMKYWRPHSHKPPASQASSPLDTSSATSYSHGIEKKTGISAEITVRRSDEVLRHHGREPHHNTHDDDGMLTAARRASSWGEPIHYVEDVTSLNSGEHDLLDDDAMFIGAGGICNDPSTLVSNLPLGLTNHAPEVINNLSHSVRHPQPERLLIGASIPSVLDPSTSDHRQLRSATTSPSPLAQVVYGSQMAHSDDDDDDGDGGEEYDDDEDDDLDDDSSFFRDTHAERQAESEAFRAGLSQMYHNLEDEDSEEEVPIEVKRRRPSVSVTAASPPPLSDFSDDSPMR